jgi:hypothetical protein
LGDIAKMMGMKGGKRGPGGDDKKGDPKKPVVKAPDMK